MKNTFCLLSTVCCLLFATGCASLDTVAYRTVGATATTVDAAMQAWGDWVRAGHATASDEAAVRDAYETYQLAMQTVQRVVTLYHSQQATEDQLRRVLGLLIQSAEIVVETVNTLRAPPASSRAGPPRDEARVEEWRVEG